MDRLFGGAYEEFLAKRIVDDSSDAGAYEIDIACTGADCYMAELLYSITFPCAFLYDYTATRT